MSAVQRGRFVEYNQVFVVNLVQALVGWLAGVFIFIPLAEMYLSAQVVSFVAFMFIVEVTYFMYKVVRHSGPLLGYYSEWLTDYRSKIKSLDSNDKKYLYCGSEKAVNIVFIFSIYFVYCPLLDSLNPVINGMVLTLVLLYILSVAIKPHKVHEEI
jgi:hypothetical protein